VESGLGYSRGIALSIVLLDGTTRGRTLDVVTAEQTRLAAYPQHRVSLPVSQSMNQLE